MLQCVKLGITNSNEIHNKGMYLVRESPSCDPNAGGDFHASAGNSLIVLLLLLEVCCRSRDWHANIELGDCDLQTDVNSEIVTVTKGIFTSTPRFAAFCRTVWNEEGIWPTMKWHWKPMPCMGTPCPFKVFTRLSNALDFASTSP